MAVSSVSAAATAVQQQTVSARQMQEVDRSRENNDAARVREVQPAEQQAPQTERAEMTQSTAATEQQQPVVNAQGQKTGTIINTTA